MEPIHFTSSKYNDAYGSKIMSWNRFIVWNKEQEEYLKKFSPNALYIRVGYIDFVGKVFCKTDVKNKNILSIFDVTPSRPLRYTTLGFAESAYYTEELNIKFLQDIKEILNDDKWIIFWKPKRSVGKDFISDAFKRKQSKLIGGNLIRVDSDIAASSLVESSDAVISMPFSSPSVIAKFKDVPCIFYDASGCVRNKRSYGIPLLRSKAELKEWLESMAPNNTLDMNDINCAKVS
jgi:polysaccharide biosynthesis PFTS motif protein